MTYVLAALLFTFVLWKVCAFFANHPPKITLPPVSVPVWKWAKPEETPEELYHRALAMVERLPITEEELELCREALRKNYIECVLEDFGEEFMR